MHFLQLKSYSFHNFVQDMYCNHSKNYYDFLKLKNSSNL